MKQHHAGNGLQYRGNPQKQFDDNIVKNPLTGCWLWKGAYFASGYGQINNKMLQKSPTTTHRASWELHRGKIPDGLMVLHKCDDRRCANPDHLYLGNNQDNMIDRSKRGVVHQMRLTEENVREMRRLRQEGWPWRKLAERYSVAMNAVISATMGKSWAYIDEPIPTIKIKSGGDNRNPDARTRLDRLRASRKSSVSD